MDMKSIGFRHISDFEITEELLDKWGRHASLEEQWYKLRNTPRRWELIRRIYAEFDEDIFEAGRENHRYGCDPYFVDWSPIFTPIEDSAWSSIRCKPVPFYPQYPALNYFLDFANPCVKIGVEVDGKDWHDVEKDRRRDERLVAAGWKIFRISGSECWRDWKSSYEMFLEDYTERQKEAEIQRWIMETSDGIFEAIRILYFNDEDPLDHPNFDLAVRSLNAHRLVDFDLFLGTER